MSGLDSQLRAALGTEFTLERELGGGGMSRVFLAREVALDRLVVVKVHPYEMRGLATDRFRREIQTVAQLQHPNIVPVLTAGESDGLLYFVMPYVEGESLRVLLERERPLSVHQARAILHDVTRALAYAHSRGIVHRDIKPDNILLTGDAAMVSDFGVAKAISSAKSDPDSMLTAVGTSLGTPSYIAPEQAAGDANVDHRADLYALGVVAYEMLAGEPPFSHRSAQQLIVAHIVEAPRPLDQRRPDLPPWLTDLVMRCLEKDPDKRPADAHELLTVLDGEAERPAARPRVTSRRSRWGWAAAVALLAVVAATLAVLAKRRPALGTASTRITSLAVLPILQIGGGDDYFADGMTEELITALGRISGLRVASRTSVYAYKAKRDADIRDIAKRLAVGAVLEGSIRRDAGRLRLNAQLTSGADGLTLWSETYQRDASDLFAVQDELARSIAGALKMRLEGAPPNDHGTRDLVAYDLYLKGRHRWHQRGEPALKEAASYFQQAIARDSNFARAWAGLGDVLGLLPVYGTTPMDSVYGTARAAAERAIRLDSMLAEAYATLGELDRNTGRWATAAVALQRAVALDSTYATAVQWLGELYTVTGQIPEAVAAMERAARLDSMSPIIIVSLAHAYGLAGRQEEADRAVNRALEMAPDLGAVHMFAGSVSLSGGRIEEAAARFERAMALSPGYTPLQGLVCFARTQKGDRSVESCRGLEPGPGVSWTAVALGALARGDRAGALAALERGIKSRDAFLYASSLTAPWWKSLWPDPAFQRLAREMGVRVGQ